jgi:hypothetical protein
MRRIKLAALAVFSLFISSQNYLFADEPANQVVPVMDLQIPLVKNQGQYDPIVKYSTATFLGQVLITDDSLTYIIPKLDQQSQIENNTEVPAIILKESFVGANTLNLYSGAKAVTKANYYNMPEETLSNIETYQEVLADELWGGVRLTLRAGYSNLEKIFEVASGINPEIIRMQLEGVGSLSVDSEGQLEANTALGKVVFSKPVAWQQIGTEVHSVEVGYQVLNTNQYGFSVGAYNPDYPLLIDPLIVATYVGGTGTEALNAVARDSSGNIYAVGNTSASNGLTGAPYTPPGPGVGTVTATQDVVVFKINSGLTTLSSWAVLGGSGVDAGRDIKISPAGDVFVLSTCQTGFPTTVGAYDTTLGGTTDICVSRLNSNLNSLVASTFIGGGGVEAAGSMAYDSVNSRVILTGTSAAAGYPTTCTLAGVCTAFQTVFSASTDFVISVFNESLTGAGSLLSSTYYGGAGAETIPGLNAVTLDSSSNIIFTGQTASSGLASVSGYDSTAISGSDAIVVKFDQDLATTGRIGATYYAETSGTTTEGGYAIAVDEDDNVYLAAIVAANTMPIPFGSYNQVFNGGTDILLAKFNSTLSSLVAATYLGGAGNEIPYSLILDDYDNLIVVGSTTAALPVNPTACYATFMTSTEGIIIKINTDLTTGYRASYFAGTGNADAISNIIISDDLIYMVGTTNTTGLTGGFDTTISGTDGFIAKLDPDLCVAPSVLNVDSSAANGTYGIGSVIPIAVTFTGPVNAIGIPAITLETGAIDQVVNYSSGTGTNELIFNYTVSSGDVNADLDYISTAALSTQIQSIGGTAANLTLATPGNQYSLSNNKNIVIDGVIPSSPTVSDPADGSYINTDTPTLTGLAEAGATVEVYVGALLLCTDTANAFGIWSCTTSSLVDDSYLLSIIAIDAALNESAPLNYSITIDSTSPASISIDTPADSSLLNSATQALDGVTEAFASVTVSDGLNTICSTTANAIGGWSCNTVPLAEGLHTISATATDFAGNSVASAITAFTIDTVAPSGTAIISPISLLLTNDITPSISGVGENGADITVLEGMTTLCTATVNSGTWSCTSSALSDGLHTISATATDAAGNTGVSSSVSFTVNTALPAAPVISTPADNAIIEDTTPLFTGTAEALSTVDIYDGVTLLGSVQADAMGVWAYASTSVLSIGSHSILVQATSLAGNTSAQSGITLNIVSLSGSGCGLVNYDTSLQAIDTLAERARKIVRRSATLNTKLARAGICKRVRKTVKNANIASAQNLRDEILSLTASTIPGADVYFCSVSNPSGCSSLPITAMKNSINANASGIENLVDSNLGRCERVDARARQRARKVRTIVNSISAETESIQDNLVVCAL